MCLMSCNKMETICMACRGNSRGCLCLCCSVHCRERAWRGYDICPHVCASERERVLISDSMHARSPLSQLPDVRTHSPVARLIIGLLLTVSSWELKSTVPLQCFRTANNLLDANMQSITNVRTYSHKIPETFT